MAFTFQLVNMAYHIDWPVDTEKIIISLGKIPLDHGVWSF